MLKGIGMTTISESWESARRSLLESDANNLSDSTGNTLEDGKESQTDAYTPIPAIDNPKFSDPRAFDRDAKEES